MYGQPWRLQTELLCLKLNSNSRFNQFPKLEMLIYDQDIYIVINFKIFKIS